MKKITVVMMIFLFFCMAAILYAGEKFTKKDVEVFMMKAITFAEKNGKEKFFAEIINPEGPLINGELYIAALTNDIKIIVHGAKPHLNGVDMSRITDKNGVNIGKAYMNAINNGDGWCEYYWSNPATGKVQKKMGYGVRLDKETWLLTGFYP